MRDRDADPVRDHLIPHVYAGRRARRAALAAIAALFAASLFLPALEAGGVTLRGSRVLLDGWEGARAAVVAWYANPLFVAAFLAAWLERPRWARPLAASAFLLAVSSWATAPLAALAGRSVPPLELKTGFYVWLAAVAALLVSTFVAPAAGPDGGAAGSGSRPRDTTARD